MNDQATMSDYHEAIFLSGSSYSSFSSDSSSFSCGKSSASSLGLRRSTMDLSDLDSSGFPSQSSFSSRQQTKDAWSTRKTSRRTYDVKRKQHRGIEAIVHDTFFDTLPVIDITKAFSNLLSKLLNTDLNSDGSRTGGAIKFHHPTSSQRCRSMEESKVDDDFSPCQIHITQSHCADDWDHFADFQDRVDEQVISFSPFAPRIKAKAKLGRLDEVEEEEEGSDVFSF